MNYLVPSGYNTLGTGDDDEDETVEESLELDSRTTNTTSDELAEPVLHCPVSIPSHESMCQIFLEMLLPFLFAGIGMVLAGLLFDKVQHWDVFEEIHELFILVPPLLGLKGNLEMTLASRLSTAANMKTLDEPKQARSIVLGNLALCQCQALVISLLVSIVAILFNWIPRGEFVWFDTLLLCSSSMLTASIASAVLGGVMVGVVLISRKIGINPDNVVTPIAASLGDLTTLYMLAIVADFMYQRADDLPWLMPLIVIVLIGLIPVWGWVARNNAYTAEVLIAGWEPVIASMVISSGGGFILDFALSDNPGVAVFSPVINGVGGNLVAVFSSRISTYLHLNHEKTQLPGEFGTGCVQPCFLFCSPANPQKKASIVMMCMIVPGQAVFLWSIYLMKGGHITMTTLFVTLYMACSLLQVMILLHIAWWLVHRVWKKGDDPDSVAIPYLTAFGDLIGIALLTLVFAIVAL